ncbi:MAG TPA: 30S ribosomal protein S2 [Candidatus Paceibacterota bacterium]|nr:30S ribosomal protein S2 [Candidatus Paceibacterota bacterium]
MAEETTANQAVTYPEEGSREMIEAGVFYGRKKSKTNPKMKPYVLANRAGMEIVNLAKTAEGLERAVAFLKEKVQNGGLILFVGMQAAAEDATTALAKKFTMPYATNRWAGGTITNFKIVSKRIEYMKKLRTDLASGALDKYTKKERLMLEKELARLTIIFGGLEHLTKEPDVLVVVDPNLHSTAVREANRLKIPVIAFANVDSDPDTVDFLVPGNDNARRSVQWFLKKIETAMDEAMASKAAAAQKTAEAAALKAAQEKEAKASAKS